MWELIEEDGLEDRSGEHATGNPCASIKRQMELLVVGGRNRPETRIGDPPEKSVIVSDAQVVEGDPDPIGRADPVPVWLIESPFDPSGAPVWFECWVVNPALHQAVDKQGAAHNRVVSGPRHLDDRAPTRVLHGRIGNPEYLSAGFQAGLQSRCEGSGQTPCRVEQQVLSLRCSVESHHGRGVGHCSQLGTGA